MRRWWLIVAVVSPLCLAAAPRPSATPAAQPRKATAPAPSDPLAAAEEALAAGDPDRAIALLDSVVARDKKNARALLLRGTALCTNGEVERCRKDLEASVALDPNARQGWLNLSGLDLADKRYDDALAALRKAEALDPQAADNGLNQGAVLLVAGRIELAAQQFARYLERNPGSSDAYYLVATNYAFGGYAALAVDHLTRAIALDERARVRARGDANFAALADNRAFQDLLSRDSYQLPPGANAVKKNYASPYSGADSKIVMAMLNTLQRTGKPFDARVEIAPDWALFWSDVRIKLARESATATAVELSAPAETMRSDAFALRAKDLFQTLDLELLKLEKGLKLPPLSAPPG